MPFIKHTEAVSLPSVLHATHPVSPLLFRSPYFSTPQQSLSNVRQHRAYGLRHILYPFQHISRNIRIEHRSSRIYNTHIHTLTDSVIKKHGMHRLTDIVISTEGERQVAHATTDVCTGQILFDPSGSLDKIHRIIIMFLNTRSHSQYIRSKMIS